MRLTIRQAVPRTKAHSQFHANVRNLQLGCSGFILCFGLTVALLLTAVKSTVAQETNPRRQQQNNDAQARAIENAFRAPRRVELSEEVQAKLEALREKRGPEVGPKLIEFQQKINAIYTREQRARRREVIEAARNAGKSPQEQRELVNATLKLTEAQQKQLEEIRQEQQQLLRSIQQEVLAALGVAGQQQPSGARRRITPTHANVSYGPHERNVLDFWQAESDRPTPILVSIHGGGFRGGNKSVAQDLLRQCLEGGISVAAITYRLSQHAIAPASFTDSARAIQFIRSKADEWNLDASRMASTGGSAGAGLSLWLGFHDDMAKPDSADPVARQSTRLTCMYVNNGQTSYDPRFIRDLFPGKDTYQHPALVQLYDADLTKLDDLLAEKYKLFEMVSSMNYLTEDDPPVILSYNRPFDVEVTSQSVGIHHPKFGEVLKEKMDALGIRCEVYAMGKTRSGQQGLSTYEFIREQFKMDD